MKNNIDSLDPKPEALKDTIAAQLTGLGYDIISSIDNGLVNSQSEQDPNFVVINVQLPFEKRSSKSSNSPSVSQKVPFVFLTSHSTDRNVDCAKAVNQLTSLIYEDAIDLEEELEWNRLDDAVFIKEKQYFKRVNYRNITHITSDGVYLEVYTDESPTKKYVLRGSLCQVIQDLPREFIRIHRGSIINLNHLTMVNTINVILTGNVEVLISKKYRNLLLNNINCL